MPGVVGVQPGGSLAGNDSSEASSTSCSWWTWRRGGLGRFGSGLGSGTARSPAAVITCGRPARNPQNCQPAMTNSRTSGSSGKIPKSAEAVSFSPAGR